MTSSCGSRHSVAGELCSLAGFRFGQIQRAQAGVGMVLFKQIFPLQSASIWPQLLGVLNGLIPCGMVCAALAAAINTGQPGLGWQFMIFFGAGTLRLTLALMGGAQYLRERLKIQTTRRLPVFTVLFGLLLLLRAAELGIPYLSPHHVKAARLHHCADKGEAMPACGNDTPEAAAPKFVT